jgi:hypothetical protein
MWKTPVARNVAGYLAAVLVAATVAVALTSGLLLFDKRFPEILELWLTWVAMAAAIALIPVSIAAYYAETRSIRSARYFALWGAGSAIFLAAIAMAPLLALVNSTMWLRSLGIVGIAGLAGGLTFWVVSGRFAGAKENGQTQV